MNYGKTYATRLQITNLKSHAELILVIQQYICMSENSI
jgi:hypothetical protein